MAARLGRDGRVRVELLGEIGWYAQIPQKVGCMERQVALALKNKLVDEEERLVKDKERRLENLEREKQRKTAPAAMMEQASEKCREEKEMLIS